MSLKSQNDKSRILGELTDYSENKPRIGAINGTSEGKTVHLGTHAQQRETYHNHH